MSLKIFPYSNNYRVQLEMSLWESSIEIKKKSIPVLWYNLNNQAYIFPCVIAPFG